MNNVLRKGLLVLLASFFAVPCAFSDSLALPTIPLIAGSTVDPNLMLLLDSSGSMAAIVEQETDDGYDADTDYYDCDEDNTVDEDTEVYFSYSGDTSFIYYVYNYSISSSDQYVFGNESATVTERNHSETYEGKCFSDDSSYTAYLNDGYSGTYSGNFLNWYFQLFDADDESYSDGKKSNASTRMEVTQEVATELVEELSDIRVGLAQYYNGYGAKVLVDIDDIDDNSDDLTSEISEMTASGVTPLGESLQDLGWYFTHNEDEDDNHDITLHDGDSDDEETCGAEDTFYKDENKSSTITPSDDVVQYWCQQNFIVAMTDGLPTSDTSFTDTLKSYATSDDYDDDAIDDSDDLYRLNVVKAMYEADLRPDLEEDDDDDDTDTTNNVTTYMIGFADTSVTGSTLLSAMASAGGGGDYLTASNSSDLLDAFTEATQSIFSKTASMTSASFNTSEVSSDSILFMANFSTADWNGSLQAYDLTDTDNAVWDAGDVLDDYENESSDEDDIYDRNIYTYNEDTKTGVVFAFDNLSDAQKEDLYAGVDADGDGNTTEDEEDAGYLINYLWGDIETNVGSSSTNYRDRSDHRLGDIVNSSTVYVGAPELDWPSYDADDDVTFGADGESYSTFSSGDAANRTPMIYVGANDGMLHGFIAVTDSDDDEYANAGEERLAYIPGIIASSEDQAGMHYLADISYAHRFYVDLTPVVSDVYINSAWRSVLVGGLRAGGKGLFALDITDPDDFNSNASHAESLALWEFSSDDDDDFGYSYSKPTIAMMQNGKWAVITGNGYNNSGDGHAELFILFIEEGANIAADGSWTEGSDYIKIDTEVGSTDTPNGLSTPTVVDTDGDSVADRIYAGDLQGNMWVFDVSNASSSKWEVAYEDSSDSTIPEPLFTALDDDGGEQPITSAPTVTTNSNSSADDPNLLVFFGTGKYLEETDIADNLDVMSYYAVLDAGVGEKQRDDLAERTLYTSDDLRTISGDDVDWTEQYGWYFDLVDQSSEDATIYEYGERVVTDSTVSGDIIFFNSWIPDGTECSSGGESWYMSIDLSTGLAPDYAIFDADEDGEIEDESADDDGDSGYIGQKYDEGLLSSSTVSNDTQYTVDSSGSLVEREVYTGESTTEGRLAWEEMLAD